MASGNDGDPPGARVRWDGDGRRLSQEVNSEDQVAEQTEEVFRSYAFHRYQQEREERGEEVPMDPEIAEIQQEPSSTGSLVGRRLAIIGDDINERYDAEFRCMLKSLQPTKENAYEYFTRIASRSLQLSPGRRVLPADESRNCLKQDQVAEQTEEVFRSYAFHRYQQEREERGEEVPMDPEIAEIQQEPSSTGSLVGRRLAIIGDDINERYDAEFRCMLKSLQPTKENAYEYFTRIASSLFESGINWGRVIALLGFGYRMAIHVYQHGITGFLRRIARYVAEFMLRNRIAQWIAQQGGWVAALDLDNVYMKYMLAVVALVMVGHLVVRRFFRP
nr:PREDICTED: bcl-2 homologous antagonist/killer [Apteryx mantelli mantelli]